jgi:hypothetical protein
VALASFSRVDPAVVALRRARRTNRVSDVDWVDALYRVYVAAVAGLIGVFLLAGAAGDDPLSAQELQQVRDYGAVFVSALVGLLSLLAIRSGRRGGPLALEGPDVTHVLLAPVDRGPVLRSLALRQIRFGAFAGLVGGGVAGYLASRRLPGTVATWVSAGAGEGLVAVTFAVGLGYLTAGHRRALVATGIALAAGASGAMGSIALLPTAHQGADIALAIVGAAAAAVVLALGLAALGGLSVEAAERRSRLVGQLRFAVTLQDLRTALLLRRQLAQERPRLRPWLRLRRRSPLRHSVWRRGWHSVLRWPGVRIARLLALGVVAGLALRAAYEGTAPMVVVAGFALWVAAMEAVEPVAQEIDHPDRLTGAPVIEGLVHLHLAFVGMTVLLPVGLAAIGAGALAGGHPGTAALVGVATLPPALLCAIGGAVGAVRGSDPSRRVGSFLPSPEAMGMTVAARIVWPPAVAIIGTLPVLGARAAANGPVDTPVQGAVALAMPLTIILGGLLLAYVRFGDDARAWWNELTGGTSR